MEKLGNAHQTMLEALEVGRTDEGHDFVFNVKNTPVGRLFIAMIKKALNTSKYSVRLRGSHADRKGLRAQGIKANDSDVPVAHADRIRVYITGMNRNTWENDDTKNRADHFERLYESTRKELSKFVNSFADACTEIVDLKSELNRYVVACESQVKEIKNLRNALVSAEAKALYYSPKPEGFAVLTPDSVNSETVQLLAFARGYRWINDITSGYSGNFVRRDTPYAILFDVKDGVYQMSYITTASLSDLLESAKTVFDTTSSIGINAYVEHLERMSYCQMDAEEKQLVFSGSKLQAVKHIKDRTGLGLFESKRIVDNFPKLKN